MSFTGLIILVVYAYENFETHGPHFPLARNYPVGMNCQKQSTLITKLGMYTVFSYTFMCIQR